MKQIKVYLDENSPKLNIFYYHAYSAYLSKYFDTVKNIKDCDIIILSLKKIIFLNKEFYIDIYKKYKKKIVILSEEPLWDSTNDNNPSQKINFNENLCLNNNEIQIFQINHFNSNIYDFLKIPYFLTTDDNFYLRYNFYFKRNFNLITENNLLDNLKKKNILFLNEKRTYYDFNNNLLSLLSLNLNFYRTLLANEIHQSGCDDIVIKGKGWQSQKQKRQNLHDWHLDKLVRYDQKFTFFSSLENTHYKNYITEKIFDAFACLSIPLYFMDDTSFLDKIAYNSSYINLSNCSIQEAIEKIESFRIDKNFYSNYLNTQKNLMVLFSNYDHLNNERKNIISKIYNLIITKVL